MYREYKDYDIRERNTFGVPGRCCKWIEYDRAEDLAEIWQNHAGWRIKSIGAGSNLLFNEDFDGLLLHSQIKGIKELDRNAYLHCCAESKKHSAIKPGAEAKGCNEAIVEVGAGETMDDVCRWAADSELWGIENLSGIPGQAGAAAVQNIGAYGVEIKDALLAVEAFDTHTQQHCAFKVDECRYGYRTSRFKTGEDKDRYVITKIILKLSRERKPQLKYGNLQELTADSCTIQDIRNAVIALRDSKLPNPREYGNAGSFFMNPVISQADFEKLCAIFADERIPHFATEGGIKVPAAWLIDRLGWKGKEVGGARVWDKQPLVLVNYTGDATAADIMALRDAIIDDVNRATGIRLKPEVEQAN